MTASTDWMSVWTSATTEQREDRSAGVVWERMHSKAEVRKCWNSEKMGASGWE